MRRRHFTMLTIAGAFATTLGVSFGSPLERWAQRSGARIEDGETLRVRLKNCPSGRISAVLHDLDSITDGALRCEGSTVQGSIDARAFVLQFG